MKILATFDGSAFSEATIPVLQTMAGLPGAEFVFMSVGERPHSKVAQPGRAAMEVPGAPIVGGGTTPIVLEARDPQFAENRSQATDRRLHELEDYMRGIARQLPERANVRLESSISEHPAEAIIARAQAEGTDVIVMATHGKTGLRRTLFGSTTEHVVRSGVAPVLVVHATGGS